MTSPMTPCVICHADAKHSGLCCDHRYDEQAPCVFCPNIEIAELLGLTPLPVEERDF